MYALDLFVERARSAGKTLVLPEGQDPRVVIAANRIVEDRLAAEVWVLGSPHDVDASCAQAGIKTRRFAVLDYLNCGFFEDYAVQFADIRRRKGITLAQARQTLLSPIFFGCMMTRNGKADGLVAGSIASTPDMLRAAFNCIGTADDITMASSCFVMDMARPTPSGNRVLLYADCAVNPDPTARQLVDIAYATACSYRALFGEKPRVAFLSFSTAGSARNERLDKIIEAAAMFKALVHAKQLDIASDGELQADAALVPSVARSKAPGSQITGNANVLIFPDLNAGNIAYKLTQRLADARAYGPVLQGLAKPVNDLSRGCTPDDIYAVAAITVCQAAAISNRS